MKHFLLLVTGDDEVEHNLIRDAFTELGYVGKYECFYTGEALLSYLEAVYDPRVRRLPVPPLVLLDLRLPQREGIEILWEIKSDDRFKFVPVTIFSACDDPAVITSCYELGANSYIIKPKDAGAMLQTIREFDQYWLKTATLSHHVPVSP